MESEVMHRPHACHATLLLHVEDKEDGKKESCWKLTFMASYSMQLC